MCILLNNRAVVSALSAVIVISLVSFRTFSEVAMMKEFGPDPQKAIWGMTLVVKLVVWVSTGAAATSVAVAFWPKALHMILGLLLLLAWMAAISLASWGYLEGRRALADASNPLTRSERLHELTVFSGVQAGYRLDNRIASHPNTHPEDLRWLSHRNYQYGTQLAIASNPNTPVDILENLAMTADAAISRSLLRNPSLPDCIFQKLVTQDAEKMSDIDKPE